LHETKGEKPVFLTLTVLFTLIMLVISGCGSKKQVIEPIASEACISCHIRADIIDSLYKLPEIAAGGGG